MVNIQSVESSQNQQLLFRFRRQLQHLYRYPDSHRTSISIRRQFIYVPGLSSLVDPSSHLQNSIATCG
jgi:hypothetical protein